MSPMGEGIMAYGGMGGLGACQSNLGQCLHCIDETATSREQRTKGGEEVNISHLGGIHYYCQHPLVMRRERKEKPKERHNIMLKRKVRHESNRDLPLSPHTGKIKEQVHRNIQDKVNKTEIRLVFFKFCPE